jgi:transcriptional regulator GlxA family with amidase domain
MIDVTMLFLDGGFASTAVGPMEIFRHAGVVWNMLTGADLVPRFRVTSASLTGQAVRCDGPLTITPATAIAAIDKTDLIFVTSTGLDLDTATARNARLLPWLQHWHQHGARIAGVCSGVALLAEAGLLNGKRATTHWGLADRLRQHYPAVHWMPEFMVTEDGGLYCGGGVHAALDLSLYLVEKYCGHDTAVQCARAMLIETPRTWQAGFAIVPLRTHHHDAAIAQAQEWMHEHFHREVSVDDLAGRLAMSARTFARRFKAATGDTPLGYLQKLRIALARRLLEHDYRTVQEISRAVGYDDTTFFRHVFRRHTGVSPQAYRQRFGKGGVAYMDHPPFARVNFV